MRKYVIKRVAQILLTLYIYVTIVFIIVAAQPGDISQVYISNPRIPPEARDALKHRLGLDQPLHIQYLNYLKNIVTGNLGLSFTNYPQPVWEIIKERLPRTLALFLTATIIYYALAFQLGKLIAWRRGGVVDYSATVSGVVLWTVYTPWFGLLLIWIFAFQLGWFPIGKFIDPLKWRPFIKAISPNDVFNYILLYGGGGFVVLLSVYLFAQRLLQSYWTRLSVNVGAVGLTFGTLGYLLFTTHPIGYLAQDILWHMILPAFALTCIGFGGYMLLMRDSMLDVIKEDYVMAAKAKGLPDKVVRDKHAARNALLPVVTSFVLSLAFAVDGGIVTETIFSWPGMGLTLLRAVVEEDLPLAIGTFVFTGIFALIAHLIADLLYAYLDPRIRYT